MTMYPDVGAEGSPTRPIRETTERTTYVEIGVDQEVQAEVCVRVTEIIDEAVGLDELQFTIVTFRQPSTPVVHDVTEDQIRLFYGDEVVRRLLEDR